MFILHTDGDGDVDRIPAVEITGRCEECERETSILMWTTAIDMTYALCRECIDKDEYVEVEIVTPNPAMFPDSEIMRVRVTHGWSFRDLKDPAIKAVRAYLADGNPNHLPVNYRTIRDHMFGKGQR